MAGFSGVIYKTEKYKDAINELLPIKSRHDNGLETRFVSGDSFYIQQVYNQKFLNDKVLHSDADCVIGLEGVIFNLNELKQASGYTSAFDVLKWLFINYDDKFVARLRGDFSGFIFDKKTNIWFVFTNHTGAKRIFHYQNKDVLIFASELQSVSKILKSIGIVCTLNKYAAYSILTNGFMLNHETYLEGVERLLPGTLMQYGDGKMHLTQYFHLSMVERNRDSHAAVIDNVDNLFRQAIQREFEKDKEYGYDHIATLSGGLDSRMTVLMAHKMGYHRQLNFTFSQANYLDEQIAKQIAIDHQHEFLFQSLDNGNYLSPIDEIVSYNDGLIIYAGSAHMYKSCRNMNFNPYGIVHTGLIGDAVLGSFLSKPQIVKPELSASVYSSKLLAKATPYIHKVQSDYSSEELYKFYGRGFSGAMNGNYYLDVFTQSASPFLDLDFLSYCYSIPENLKFKQKIYIDWIELRNKEFARYPWEKTGVSPLKSLNNKKYFDLAYYKRMSLKFFDKIAGQQKSGMNPFDYWLTNNKALADTINSYFHDNIERVNEDELRNDCIWLYQNGNWGERFQVVTLLAALKLHF